ncbi:MAG: phenylalanine--tRNA ligase subunit alpha [Bdellovibrionales bacterium]|nr:phenylalanine--tRNA ligase subunit alpha [Bdellovibrionales bacterium]
MSIPQKEKERIENLFEQIKSSFNQAENEKKLYDFKVKFLGKKSPLSIARKKIKDYPIEKRPAWGEFFNKIFEDLDHFYLKKQKELSQKSLDQKIEKEAMDLSLPGPYCIAGAKHPITRVIESIIKIFTPLGYSIQTGPYVESDWYNFSALNFPPFHPSRDLQDTFYIGENHVLRTHTSPVQIRTLQSQKAPLAVLAPGAVFRADSDVSHSPMFHQIEGLYVNKKVSLAELKGTLSYFLKHLFQSSKMKVRFRPSFFPFTEPSAEYDISCPFCFKGCSVCKKSTWIEIGGCGLVHPEVFRFVDWDSTKWQGFAFGLGIERLAILLFNIPDIRLFFENDIRFLNQFSSLG